MHLSEATHNSLPPINDRGHVSLVVGLLMLVVAFLSNSVCAASTITNHFCPVQEGEKVDPECYTDYNGNRVYFSDDFSKELFLSAPEDYAESLARVQVREVSATPIAQPPPPPRSKLLVMAGKVHPPLVHFPIALIIAALLAEIISEKKLSWRNELTAAARFCLWVGALSAVAAATSGWIRADTAEIGGDMASVLTLHRWLGIETAVSAWVCVVFNEWMRRNPTGPWRQFYLLTLFASCALAGAAGHFGSLMVYGAEYWKF